MSVYVVCVNSENVVPAVPGPHQPTRSELRTPIEATLASEHSGTNEGGMGAIRSRVEQALRGSEVNTTRMCIQENSGSRGSCRWALREARRGLGRLGSERLHAHRVGLPSSEGSDDFTRGRMHAEKLHRHALRGREYDLELLRGREQGQASDALVPKVPLIYVSIESVCMVRGVLEEGRRHQVLLGGRHRARRRTCT